MWTNVFMIFQEFDTPYNLLQRENGFLTKMVQQTGPSMAEQLRKIAEDSRKSWWMLKLIYKNLGLHKFMFQSDVREVSMLGFPKADCILNLLPK